MNTINFHKSMHYNPFAYIHEEKDILKLVTTLMANTKGEGTPFWEKSEKLLYTALIAYLHYEAPAEEQNFATLLQLLNAMEVREDDEEYQNPVDLLFEEFSKRKPNSFAVRQYRLFQLAAGKTMKSILISCGARLAPFDIQEIRDATMYDELELDKLGDRKTALFLIMSDTDSTFNFLISMIYTQLFNLLCDKADDQYGGKLPVHVRCLIDECANIGQIPQLEKLVATIRSREISACLVLQTRSQLKAIYKDNADTIVGNMDSQIFLGGSEPTTLKELSEALGKETINNRIVCFDIKQLGKQLKKLGMLIVQDAVWGRVTANRSAGKSTRYYVDEFHLLLKEAQTAAYSIEIWKRFRKWGGLPTAITQNVKDLLASPEVSNIFENSDFVYMLNQANGDRQILAKQLNISPHQLSYVIHSGEGEGLLF